MTQPFAAPMDVLPSRPTPTFPYRILREVGHGAMGMVFQAEDIELGRVVAIKVIRPSILAELSAADVESLVDRFIQEARATAALQHPGVPAVHRVAREGRWPYIAMEWVEGRTVEELLLGGRSLSPSAVARLGIQVLSVLDTAHRQGIVHRDIKPANLMITREGQIKVADFGIARMSQGAVVQTLAGTVMGTPQYAAPEQIDGRAIDGRADLHALAATMYEALAGRAAFTGDSVVEILMKVQTDVPEPPSRWAPAVPPALDAVVLRGMAKRPEDRFASAREMATALQPFLAGTNPGGTGRLAVGEAPTVAPTGPATILVPGSSPHAIVGALIHRWPPKPLGRQATRRLLDRVQERPLHAPAFSGAVELADTCLLVADGTVHLAFDRRTGDVGDALIEALPESVDPVLHALPDQHDPRLVPALASLLLPDEPRLAGLDTSVVDMARFADKLASEEFDGAIRFVREDALGFALYSRGRALLTVFGDGWPQARESARWQQWALGAPTVADVCDRRSHFPALTYRRHLADLAFTIAQPEGEAVSGLRSDTLAERQALRLVPEGAGQLDARRGDSTIQSLLLGDTAYADARWLLTDVATQFEQYDRASRWKGLVGALPEVERVVLHHDFTELRGPAPHVDVATYGAGGGLLHIVRRVALGASDAVTRLIADAIDLKTKTPDGASLAAAILIAPTFDDGALNAYFKGLRRSGTLGLWARLDAFGHREGFLRTGARAGFHVLLVEETQGRRRPLMPQ